MQPPDVAALLRALPIGRRMWVEARGRSMWPLLWPGDTLQVQRCQRDAFIIGDVALMARSDGLLVSHAVISAEPFATASIVGRVDEPLEPLARVLRVRRGLIEVRLLAPLTRAVQASYAALARSKAQNVWQAAIDRLTTAATRSARETLFKPTVHPLGRAQLHEIATFLSRWASPPAQELETQLTRGRTAGVRLRDGSLGGLAIFHDGQLRHLVLLRRLKGLGLEDALTHAVTRADSRTEEPAH